MLLRRGHAKEVYSDWSQKIEYVRDEMSTAYLGISAREDTFLVNQLELVHLADINMPCRACKY